MSCRSSAEAASGVGLKSVSSQASLSNIWECRVQGLGSRVWGVGFRTRVLGLGARV